MGGNKRVIVLLVKDFRIEKARKITNLMLEPEGPNIAYKLNSEENMKP